MMRLKSQWFTAVLLSVIQASTKTSNLQQSAIIEGYEKIQTKHINLFILLDFTIYHILQSSDFRGSNTHIALRYPSAGTMTHILQIYTQYIKLCRYVNIRKTCPCNAGVPP